MAKQRYKIRYFMERGDYAKPDAPLARPGIRISDEYGYCDELLVASVVGPLDKGNIVLASTEDGGGLPSRALLLKVREQIDHYLEHGHTMEEQRT